MPKDTVKKYWAGDPGKKDAFGLTIGNTFIDGKTTSGPWAIMTPLSWQFHGIRRLGTGYGQRYEKQPDGRWLKVEG
jgi:hypothetical protein